MSTARINTVIVGGGQAGLAISYYLRQQGREHVVLERAPAVADAWRNQRWDSFTLVTPNFQVRMPGAQYAGDDCRSRKRHAARGHQPTRALTRREKEKN
jgi:putative flavoprotein involved in K+ transport